MMQCSIYKSSAKSDTYLYVEREHDFARVPPALLAKLGQLEWVMNLELLPARPLARADAGQVLARLRAAGYFLQMPPVRAQL